MLIRTLVGCYYNKITTVCACKPTHTFSYAHTHMRMHARARTYSRQYIFSSVPTSAHACAHTHILFSSVHFLIRTHKYTRARSRTRGVLGQGTPHWTHWAHCPKPH